MTQLADIMHDAQELSQQQGWVGRTAEQRFLYLASEVGEVAEAVLRLTSARKHGDENSAELTAEVGAELYDVIWNVCDLANLLDIDLEDAARRKRALNQTRRW